MLKTIANDNPQHLSMNERSASATVFLPTCPDRPSLAQSSWLAASAIFDLLRSPSQGVQRRSRKGLAGGIQMVKRNGSVEVLCVNKPGNGLLREFRSITLGR